MSTAGASSSEAVEPHTVLKLSKLLELERCKEIQATEAQIEFSSSVKNWIKDTDHCCQAPASSDLGTEANIFRVSELLMDNTNQGAYEPKYVPLGPFHHKKTSEFIIKQKKKVKDRFIRESGKSAMQFASEMYKVLDKLKKSYGGNIEISDDDFLVMMITDGIFLLDFMHRVQAEVEDFPSSETDCESETNCEFYGSVTKFRSDAICIENQIPLLALHILESLKRGSVLTFTEMNNMVLDFLARPQIKLETMGLHCLDLLHRSYIGTSEMEQYRGELCSSMHQALYLHEAGVSFRASERDFVNEIRFDNGTLQIPMIHVHSEMNTFALNLIAYEQVNKNAGHYFMSYVFLLDNLISTDNDVRLLAKKGILTHGHGDEKSVADLFNRLNKGMALNKNSTIHLVQLEVNAYCKVRWHWWYANVRHFLLGTPAMIFGVVMALFGAAAAGAALKH